MRPQKHIFVKYKIITVKFFINFYKFYEIIFIYTLKGCQKKIHGCIFVGKYIVIFQYNGDLYTFTHE